jgi:hypothetical protein
VELADDPTATRTGPIFILGPMGSGTTLLRLMLDSHPHIAIPPETGFMRAYNAHRFIPFKATGGEFAERLGFTDEEFDARLAEFYDGLFRHYASAHGKQRWGEKTPLHVWHVPALQRLFRDCAFVCIVRHPGGSIGSNFRRWREPLERYIWHWNRYTREILRLAATRPRRAALLRYEDLVLDPEAVMRPLIDWLNEPWSDDVLAHHEVQSSRGGARTVVEGRTSVADPVDAARISKWTEDFTAVQRALMVRRTGALARVLGYDPDDPLVLEPPVEGGGPLLTGFDVQEIVERNERLKLLERWDVPGHEQLYKPWNWSLEAWDGKKREAETREPRKELRRSLDLLGGRLPRPLKRRVKRRFRWLRRRLRN